MRRTGQLLDERDTELAVEPKPLRVVVVVVLRAMTVVEDRPASGTEADGVAEVPAREKIGTGQMRPPLLLLVLLLVLLLLVLL
jgi:hypothetical protein